MVISRRSGVFDPDSESGRFQAGQLRFYIDQWESLEAPESLLNIINGYTIPFGKIPPLIRFNELELSRFETKSSPQMDEEMLKMRREGIVKETQVKSGFLSTMFLIPKSDGSFRQIFNLKRLNDFLLIKEFKLISHYKVPNFLQKGDFLLKVDFSQAYFHVWVKESHQRFLSLVYRGKVYSMTCLPFGLASTPESFASISNWIASYLRNLGIRVIVYLDDFLLASQDSALLIEQGKKAIEILRLLGWKVNLDKSHLTPQTELEYLGITWNPSKDFKFISQEKQRKLKRSLRLIVE